LRGSSAAPTEVLLAKKKWEIADLSDAERVALAKSKSDDLINRLLQVVRLHESNRIVTYSDTLAKQIPASFAAHAFNEFQGAVHLFEITRLCALWDPPGQHRVSIPTVVELINEPRVLQSLDDETADWWKGGGALEAFEQTQVESIRRKLRGAMRASAHLSRSKLIRRFRDFRNAYLAHSLKGHANELGNPKYGQERRLVRASIEIVHRLYLGIHNTDFALRDATRQAERNARELWDNCAFNIPRPS
jgi:hypothetical protein